MLQHILRCPDAAKQKLTVIDDPNMVAVVMERGDGVVESVSVASSDIDPLTRLNPDYPAKDWR